MLRERTTMPRTTPSVRQILYPGRSNAVVTIAVGIAAMAKPRANVHLKRPREPLPQREKFACSG
jgi:hypothetical protein